MPYLNSGVKASIDSGRKPTNGGELNYLITTILIQFLKDQKLSYSTLNEVIGALECCKSEFYRRVVAPYENLKVLTNGDAYPDHL